MIIEIEGNPEPQARMKFTRIGGFGRAYDPKAKQKDQIRNILRSKAALQVYEYPKISFIFFMPIPSGISKKKLVEMKGERIKHVKRPDCDNLLKLYLDCMDGIVFERDEHVSLGLCVKLYSPRPRTLISIRETKPFLEEWEFHQAFVEECDKLEPSLSLCQCESYNRFPLILSQCDHMKGLDCKVQPSIE